MRSRQSRGLRRRCRSLHPIAQRGCALSIPHKRWETYRVLPKGSLRLGSIPTDATDFCADKKVARDELKSLRKQINDLAETLAIENKRSLLVILQGMDASG